MGFGSAAAHFDDPSAKSEQRIWDIRILVEAGTDADGVVELGIVYLNRKAGIVRVDENSSSLARVEAEVI